MRVLFIEPFFGGSHRAFAEGLRDHSAHTIELFTLPSQNWSWRIHGAALYCVERIPDLSDYDGIITSSMMRVADLKAFAGSRLPPVLVYEHESQLTYPTAAGTKVDVALAMADISTALAADRLLFNSRFHYETYLTSVQAFMKRVPDYPPAHVVDKISEKSGVLYPGLSFKPHHGIKQKTKVPPLVIWNHRWSFDKNAPSFFYALDRMVEKGIDFEVAVLGEHGGWVPDVFERARQRLGKRVVHFGFVEDSADYIDWLSKGDLAVSTAHQENFGMAMVEAMKYGCLPLLPSRLSYPEIVPESMHADFLYTSQKDFLMKMERILTRTKEYGKVGTALTAAMDQFSWPCLIDSYDREIDSLCT